MFRRRHATFYGEPAAAVRQRFGVIGLREFVALACPFIDGACFERPASPEQRDLCPLRHREAARARCERR
jgi:hypothetical protein